jgi:hypothetical protein
MGATYAVTAKPADVSGQRRESVFEPGLANLFEAVAVRRATAHPK